MKQRSAINKGLRLVNYLVEILRESVDEKAYAVTGSGAGLDKQDIRLPARNIEIEAKNWDNYAVGEWLDQAESQRTSGNVPVVMARDPKQPEFKRVVVIMELGDWIELINQNVGSINTGGFVKEDKWVLSNLEKNLKQVLKIINKSTQ